MNTVFVYGTLKGANHVRGLNQFEGSHFVGEATTTESQYMMYDLGAFPAVMCGGGSDVQGEVWKVTNDVMDILDQIEGYPNFYNRKIVETSLGPAWMYYFVEETQIHETVDPVNGILEWA